MRLEFDTTKNNRGKIAELYDQSGNTDFSQYDFNGNVLQTAKTFAQEYANTLDWTDPLTVPLQGETFSHSFTYDALNRPLTKILPDNTVQEFTYNKAGLLETVKNNNQLYVENINYNAKGQRIALYFGNGSKTKYEYDANTFRLTRLLTTRNTGTDIVQDLNYTYDPVGNITEQIDNAQQTFYFSNAVIEPKGQYTYDALYRLTEAKGRELASLQLPTHEDFANSISVPNVASNAMQNYTQQYSYDILGNILQIKSVGKWTRDYFYNSYNNNYLIGHSENTTEYTYDAHGNILTMPHLQAMNWDYKNQLQNVELDASGNKTFYVYNSGGNRIRKVVEKGNIKEERYYLGDYEVYRKFVNGTLQTERTTVDISDNETKICTIDKLTVDQGSLTTDPSPVVRFQYDNYLGSSSLELDESASIISYEEYHPFGTTSYRSGRSETEVSMKKYKYVGKERDEETGLYYFGARYYAAWLGRWTAVDPLAKKNVHLTPYNYCSLNPIVRVDPDGKDDYYNKAGKWVGSDGEGNGIRITNARTKEMFNEWMTDRGAEGMRNLSSVVTVQENVAEAISKIYKDSNDQQVERKAYVVLDTNASTLTIEEQPRVKGDVIDRSINEKEGYTFDKTQKFITPLGAPANKVIVGQIHGHPNKKSSLGYSSGYSTKFEELKVRTSKDDKDAAADLGVPVHAIDYTGKVHRVDQYGNEDPGLENATNIIIESLEISGGKVK